MPSSRRFAVSASSAALIFCLLAPPAQAGDLGDKLKEGWTNLVNEVREGLKDLFGGGGDRGNSGQNGGNNNTNGGNQGQSPNGYGGQNGSSGGSGGNQGTGGSGGTDKSGDGNPQSHDGEPPPPPDPHPSGGQTTPPPQPGTPPTEAPPDEGNTAPPPEDTQSRSRNRQAETGSARRTPDSQPSRETLAPAAESSASEQPYSLAQLVKQRDSTVRNSRENILSRLQTDFAGKDPARGARSGSLAGLANAGRRPPASEQSGGHTGQGRGIYVDAGALLSGPQGGLTPRQEAFRSRAQNAEMKMRFGDLRAAAGEADQAINLDPGSAAGYLLKARILNRMGRFAEAEAMAAKAAELSTDDASRAEALQEQAWAQLNQGKVQDALASSAGAVRAGNAAGMREGTAKSLVTQAFVCERMNNRDCVIESLTQAVKLDARFQRYLDLAKAGKRIFDPNAEDSWKLLEAVAEAGGAPAKPGFPWLPVAGGAGVLGAAGAWFLRRRSRRNAGGVVRIPGAPGPAAPAPAADLLAGKYQMLRVIGTGAGGQVWEAHDHPLDRSVVFKRLAAGSAPAGGTASASSREADLQVARSLATLNHPNVVDIYEVLDLPAGLHLVLERMEGETVRQLLTRDGRLPLAEVKRILKSVCVALEFIHSRGIVHRNLKPSNIMRTAQGFVKIMDIALPGQPFGGSPAYLAPEARRGVLGPSVDVFALGACFHEMLTGKPPGRADTRASSLVPGLDPEVDRFLERALAEDPARRIASVREFAAQLGALPDSAR